MDQVVDEVANHDRAVPVRLTLSRRRGFNLQEHSHAINGLIVLKCRAA